MNLSVVNVSSEVSPARGAGGGGGGGGGRVKLHRWTDSSECFGSNVLQQAFFSVLRMST